MPPSDRLRLVSRSPRRSALLDQIGIAFEVLSLRTAAGRPVDVDETPLPGEDPASYVVRLARAKAAVGRERAGARDLPDLPALGADTTVTLDGHILGKPESPAHAAEMLARLADRDHVVHTAVAVAAGGRVQSALSSSRVRFRALGTDEIRRYVDSGEPMDKAGAYGIQGRAACFVREIAGSYSGIVGLPLFETAQLLAGCGFVLP